MIFTVHEPHPRAAIYLRRTGDDPHCHRQSEAVDFVRARCFNLVDTFVDDAGTDIIRRPVAQAMLAAARNRRFDVLVVASAAMICRSIRELVVLIDELAQHGVDFASANDRGLDTTVNMSVLDVARAMIKHERAAHGELSRRGLLRTQRAGVRRIGRPPRQFNISEARRLQRSGKSLKEISDRLHVPKTTLYRALMTGVGVPKTPRAKSERKPRPRPPQADEPKPQASFAFAAAP